MQSQQYNLSPHSGYYDPTQNSYPMVQDQYTASNVGDFASFSRGSPLVYPQDYQYFSDRGPSSGHSTANFTDNHTVNTASGFAENSTPGIHMNYHPEDMMAYQHPWRWTDAGSVAISTPMYSDADTAENSLDYQFIDPSTAVSQLPTPAAMAIMFNHNSQSDVRRPQVSYQVPSSQVSTQTSATAARPSRPEPGQVLYGVPDSQSREKKHACTMCHKRFDRPSTLRKASATLSFVFTLTGDSSVHYSTCSFTQAKKRSYAKPAGAGLAWPQTLTVTCKSGSPSAHSVSPVPSNSSQTQTGSMTGQNNKRARDAAFILDQFDTSMPQEGQLEVQSEVKSVGVPKRRRRAPSPTQWVPHSLCHFNLFSEDLYKSTTVPLPPVRRCLPREERDSWDENVNATPYHPRGWKNVLPGPGLGICSGLGSRDVRNLNIDIQASSVV
ncbi:hypothetical protein AX15_003842 [Amanita polypyramis BW_CC]|nr:hypothetical protein AX15_003842 [Amanita polypyramis BW_CC]